MTAEIIHFRSHRDFKRGRDHFEDDSEGDPQPEIDHEQLDRMYRYLNSDAYSLQAEHPKTGKAIVESFATLNSAVARARELMQSGYSTGIWSPAYLEKR